MDRISQIVERFQEIDPLIAGVALFFIGLILVLLPSRFYYGAVIVFAVAWLNINRFVGLGAIAALAKATFLFPFILLWLFATYKKGPRRDATWVSWIYVVVPFLTALCIVSTTDAQQGALYCLSFFAAAACALQVVRTLVDQQSLRYFMTAYLIGLMVPLGLMVFAFLEGGHKHYHFVHSFRFHPFGAGSNQVVPLFAQIVAVGTYQFHSARNLLPKALAVLVVGTTAALSLKTGSRQSFLILLVFFAPYVLTMVRRPIYLILFAIIGVGGFYWVFISGGELASTQLTRATHISDTGGRIEIAMQYLEVLTQRPVTGLMGTSGESIISAKEVGNHTHNAFIEMLYWGGLLIGAPLFVAAAASLWSAIVVIRNRRMIALDPACPVILASALLAVYFHGLTANMVYTSVSTWPFYHFVLSGLLVALCSDVSRVKKQGAALPQG